VTIENGGDNENKSLLDKNSKMPHRGTETLDKDESD
jgi:hypothetical protein